LLENVKNLVSKKIQTILQVDFGLINHVLFLAF